MTTDQIAFRVWNVALVNRLRLIRPSSLNEGLDPCLEELSGLGKNPADQVHHSYSSK